MTYTFEDIEAAWKQYDEARAVQVLKDGKWKTLPAKTVIDHIDGTSARMKYVKDILDFPDYLRDEWSR